LSPARSAVSSTPAGFAGVGAPLDEAFFARSVHDVARDLVGCGLRFREAGGVIVEVESYHADDPACHAYVGRTERNAVLFGRPGLAYVYFSYGIHNLLNAVCEAEGDAAAVLIRALEPRWGVDAMRRRRRRADPRELCSGPGKLTEALGIGLGENGTSLLEPPFELTAPAAGPAAVGVVTAPRIGISRGVEYPWRFCAAGSRFLSRPVPQAPRRGAEGAD
jgi:DNA-3-methyladenine glycosylase